MACAIFCRLKNLSAETRVICKHIHTSANFHRHVRNLTALASYDYVVVGAGSAGCVVANRLIQGDPNNTVLLIEAGPSRDDDILIKMPAALRFILMNPKYSWCYESAPQKQLNGRRLPWPRGRLLGGSSSLNGMIYIRGHQADYDRWAYQEGATGWSYAECLPYFIKSQSHSLGANQYRGSTGYQRVQPSRSKYTTMHRIFVEAGIQAGYPSTDDFNGAEQEGFGSYDLTINNGQRASTATMYLRPVLDSDDGQRLSVLSETLVRRVLFDGKHAIGVELQTKQQPVHTVLAKKEVILCGGAINSPQLLMLSGVGPADHLRQHDIPLIHHSPGVGSNLQDHLMICCQYTCTQPVTIYRSKMVFPLYVIKCWIEWMLWKTGDASAIHHESGAFIRSRPDVQQPDIQMHFLPWTFSSLNPKLPTSHGFQIFANPCRPTSRGTIRLQSRDPEHYPIIDPNYLATAEDLSDMKTCIRAVRRIVEQRSFDNYRGKELNPGIEHVTDSQLEAYIRRSAGTIYHPTSTCRMGSPDDDSMSVVDTSCKVIGVEGLRVVDASVMPSIISGNTNAPTIMIAEKASDMILGRKPLPKANIPQ